MDNQNFGKVEKRRVKATTKRKKPLDQEALLNNREGGCGPVGGGKQSDQVGIKSENDAVEDWKPELWQRNGHIDGSGGLDFNTSNNEISSMVPISKGSNSENSMGPLSQSNTMPGQDSSGNELSNLGGGGGAGNGVGNGGGIKTPGSLPPTPSSQHSSQPTSQPNSQPPPGSSQQMPNSIRPSSNMGPNGPVPRGSGRPQSTGIPEGMVNGPGGHFMSQQSQIFVFSTGLANEAAEVVQRGQCRSIVEYHLEHPATRQFLQNFPMGSNSFNRPQSMPPYPDSGVGKFPSKDHQMPFNETGSALANVELWVQQQNASLQEGPFSPSFGPSGSSKQSRSSRSSNSGNQRWLPSPNNWMPNNAPPPMVGEFGPDHHMQIPGGYMGDSQMPPGRGMMPGPNNIDENLTPEQMQRRVEHLAQLDKLKSMLFPEKRNEFGGRPPGMYGPGPPRPGPDGMIGMMRFPPHHPANMMPPPPGYFNEMGPQPRLSGPHSPVSPSFGMNRDPSAFFFQGPPPPGMNFPQNGPGPHPPDFHPEFMPDGMPEGMFFGPNGPVGPRMHHVPHDPMAGGPMGPFGPGTARFPGMCKPKRRRNAAGDKSEDIYRHLQPAPSPQQFCSLNLFEGQELTITRQLNLAYQDTNEDRSPSQPPFNTNGSQQHPKKKKKVDNSSRSNDDMKMSVKSEIPCTPELFSSASSLQSPMPTPNINSSSAAATTQLPLHGSNSDASANPETSPANGNNSSGNILPETKQPNVPSLPHCSAPTITKSGTSSGVMSNITSPTLASLAKGVESLSDRIEQDMLQGGLFRTVQMPENDPDISDEVLPASSQAGNRMRSNENSETTTSDSNKPGMSDAMSGQNSDFDNDKMMMMMKSEASHHMDGPPGVGMDRRSPSNHMFPEMKGHQGMVGNADVRIQARAPNTIQYMPARPPNENTNEPMPHPMPSGFNGPDFNGPMIGPDGNPMFDGGSMGPPGFDGGPMLHGDMGPGYGNPMHRNFAGPNMGNFGNGQGGPMPGFDPQGGPMFEGSMPPGMGGPMMPGFNGPPPPGYNGQGHFVNGPSGPMHPGCMPGFEGPCGPMSEFDGPMPGGPQMPGYSNFGPRPLMGGFHGGVPMGMHSHDIFGGRLPMIHNDVKPNEPIRGKGEGTTKKEKDKKKRSESNKKTAAAAANQSNVNLNMNDKNGMNIGRGGANKMRPDIMMRMGPGPDFMGMPPIDSKIRHELMGMGGGAMIEPGMSLRPNLMGGPPDGRIRPGMVRMSEEGGFMGMMDGPMMRMSRDGCNFMIVGADGPKKIDGPVRPGSGMMIMESVGENGMRPVSRSHSDKVMMGPGDGNMRPGSAMMMGMGPDMGMWHGSGMMMGPPGENRSFMSGMDGMRPDSRLSAMGMGPEGTPVRPTSASMMGLESDMSMMMPLGDGAPRPGSSLMVDGMMPGSNSGEMPMKGGPESMSMQMRANEASNQMRMAGGPDVMMSMPGMGPEGMIMSGRGGLGRMMVDMSDPRMMSEMEGMVCRNGPMSHRMDPGMAMIEMPNGDLFPGHMMHAHDRRMMMEPDQFSNSMPFDMMRPGPNFNSHGGLISGDPALGMGR